MIQRIQTLFLIGIIALMGLSFFTTFWESSVVQIASGVSGKLFLSPFADQFQADGQSGMQLIADNYHIAALVFLIAMNALFAMLQYNKRKLQIKLCMFNYLLLSGLIGLFFYEIDFVKAAYELRNINYTFGFYMPVLSIFLNFFAIRFIKKDEALIHSLNRIR